MLKFGERVVFKCAMLKLILSITMLFVNGYQVKAVSLMQGQEATLHFPYPCDSTEVILQHSHRAPFYRSTVGSSLSLPDDQVYRFKVQNRIENGNCALDLTISNLMRSDAGTYLSTIYKDRLLRDDYTTRVGLKVDYPPGKASCVVSEDKGRGWVLIDCTANVGSVSGKIECYQDGLWMPSLTDPIEIDTSLKQSILIRKSQPVFCCSSTWIEYIERCECDDTALYLDDAISSDPCPSISTKASTTSTHRTSDLVEKSQSSDYPLPSHTTSTNANKITKRFLMLIIGYPIAAIGLIIIVIVTTISFHQSRQERKNNSNEGSQNLISIIIYYISATGVFILMILNTISVYQLGPENKNNSNNESQNWRAIIVHHIALPGIVILSILHIISLCHIHHLMQERKQNSNGESQVPSSSGNVHYYYALKCETEKLN